MGGFTRFQVRRSVKRGERAVLPTATPDNRQFETDLGNGFVRVDNGAPPPRLPSETQPVQVDNLNGPTVAPPVPTVVAETIPLPKPATNRLQPTNWQREFGLGKRD